jgi:nucleotide-binding universal stress UspA family protein
MVLHVVIALNDSDNSRYCLEWTVEHVMVQDLKQFRVTLLTVVQPPVQAGYYYAASGAIYSSSFIDEAYKSAEEEATKTVRAHFKAMQAKLGADFKAELIVGRGEVRDEIVDYCNNATNDVGLLIVGSRDLGALKR